MRGLASSTAASKGEAEEAVTNVGIECVSIFRPSLILGPREEPRLKERLAKSVATALSSASWSFFVVDPAAFPQNSRRPEAAPSLPGRPTRRRNLRVLLLTAHSIP